MTKKEKLTHEEALAEIKRRINLCFGSSDGLFANHPNDRERVFELRAFAAKNDVTLQEMRDITSEYFERENFCSELAQQQMAWVVKMFKVKLKI